MVTKSWTLLLPLLFAWVISAFAGISFLKQALTEKAHSDNSRGWRKFLKEVRFRLTLAAGIGLILWVISGVIWVLFN